MVIINNFKAGEKKEQKPAEEKPIKDEDGKEKLEENNINQSEFDLLNTMFTNLFPPLT